MGTLSPGVQGRSWEGEPALLTSAGTQDLVTWNPDKKQLSPAPRGQSLLRVLLCALLEKAITQPIIQQVSHHSPGRDSPATTFPQGNSRPVPRSRSHPVSPAASHRDSRSSSLVSILPRVSRQHTEPWHALPASSSQQAERCRCSAASATHLYSCFLTILPQEDLLNAMHLKQHLPELVSPPPSPFPLMIISDSSFYALPASHWQREEP